MAAVGPAPDPGPASAAREPAPDQGRGPGSASASREPSPERGREPGSASATREPAPDRGREPKQDRSRATRQRLLESAIDCLAVHGWAATTVSVVAAQAGVSRGAAQHHYPTREELITAALQHMFSNRIALLRQLAPELPDGSGRTEAIIVRMVEYFTGPMFKAALQVWTAAAADEALKQRIVPLEAHFGRVAHRVTVELLGVDDADPVTHRLVQATLDLARGLGLADVLTDDSARRTQIVRQWAATLDEALSRRPV